MEKSKLAALIGAGIAASVSGAVIAGSENPFQTEIIQSAYNLADNHMSNDADMPVDSNTNADDASGDDASGDDASSDDASGDDASGDDASGDDASSDDASSDDANSDDASPMDKSGGGKCGAGKCGG